MSTVILTIRIEIEALLVELIRRNLPKPERFLDSKKTKPAFKRKPGFWRGRVQMAEHFDTPEEMDAAFRGEP